ncbi:MAG: hypothetical protein ACO32Z_01625 [Gemmatimonadaceae bacterium]
MAGLELPPLDRLSDPVVRQVAERIAAGEQLAELDRTVERRRRASLDR